MPRKQISVKRGAGSIQNSIIEDTALRYPKRDIDPLKVHIHDPNKAHMASSIGIIDSGDYYSSDEVEGALQEIGSTGSATKTNGLLEGGTYTSVFPSITVDNNSTALINGIERDISGLTISIGTLPLGNYFVYVETDSTDPNYLQLVATTVQPSLSDEKVLIAYICHDTVSFTYEQDARFFVKDLDRKVQYTVRQGEDVDAWSEGCFATLDSAFFYLSKFHDLGAGVTDDYRATLLVRGNHVINRTLELNNAFLTTTGIYAITIKGDGQNSITTSGSFVGNNLISLNVDTDDVNYPSAGIILEDLVLKNSGSAVLTSLVYLDCSFVYVNRCKVRENVGTFLTGTGTISITNSDITCSRVANITGVTTRLFFDNTNMTGDATLEALTCNNLTVQNSRITNFTKAIVHNLGNCVVSNSEISCKSLIDGNGVDHFGLTHFIGNKVLQSGNASVGTEVLIENYGRIGEFLFNNNICERGSSFNNDFDVWVHANGFDTITMTDNVFINYQLLKVVGDTLESSFRFTNNTCKSVSLEVETTGVINVSGNLLSSAGAANFPKLKVTNGNSTYNCTVENNTMICNSSAVNIVELTGQMKLTFIGNTLQGGAGCVLSSIVNSFIRNNVFDGRGTDNVQYNVDTLVSLNACINLSIVDNGFLNGNSGITTDNAQNLKITDNSFFNLIRGTSPLYAVGIETTNVTNTTISSNVITGTGGTGSSTTLQISILAIYATGSCTSLVIKDNVIEDISPVSGGTTKIVEIAVDSLEDSSISDNVIRGFTFPAVSSDIITVLANSVSRTNIDGNKIAENLTFGYEFGIHIQSIVLTDVSVSRNSIKAFNQNGIFFDPIITTSTCSYNRVVVNNNILTNTTTNPIDSTRLGCIRFGLEYTDTNCFINNVSIQGNMITGPNVGVMVEFTDQSATYGADLNNIVISNNNYRDSNTDAGAYRAGISLYHTVTDLVANFQFEEIVISNNLLDLNNGHDNGIHVYSQYIDMERLQINNNQINGSVNAIYLQAPTTSSSWKFVSVNGNTIEQRTFDNNGFGIRVVGATVQWEKLTVSDNHVDTTSLNTFVAFPLSINLIQSGDVVKDFLISNNVFKGLGGTTSVSASRCDLNIINGYAQGFTFQGNTVDVERGLDIQWTHVSTSDRVRVSDNTFKGRHGIVFRPNGVGTFSNCKFDGNLLDVDTTNNKDVTYKFGFVFDLNDIGLINTSINNNSIRGSSGLGGIYVNHDTLGRVSIDGNTQQVIEGEVPFIYVVGNQDGALAVDLSITKNSAAGFLLEGWSGDSPDAVVLLEYTSVGTGNVYENIKIEDNQFSFCTSDNHIICVTGKGTGTQEFEGFSGLSVSGNELINLTSTNAIYLNFRDCETSVAHINCNSNIVGYHSATQNANNGIVFDCPNPTTFITPRVSEIQINGNSIANRAASAHNAIYLNALPTYVGVNYTLQNVSILDNTINTYVANENARGIYCNLNVNVKGLSVEGNTLRSTILSTYPANGILITHTLLNASAVQFRQTGSDNGNDFNKTLQGNTYIAGNDVTGSPFASPDMRVSTDGSGPNIKDVSLTIWQNIKVSDNTVSFNSRFAENTGVQTLYPITKNGDLFVCPVHYHGTDNGITSTRSLIVVPVYGLEITNNTLRGFENSDETESYVGMVVHTCPVYGEWESNDPLSTITVGAVPQYRYVAQGWNVTNNTSTGYSVLRWNGASYDAVGADVYYLDVLRNGISNIDDELDRSGITTGNTTQAHGFTTGSIPVGTTIGTTYNGGAVNINVIIPATNYALTHRMLTIGSTGSFNFNKPDASKMI